MLRSHMRRFAILTAMVLVFVAAAYAQQIMPAFYPRTGSIGGPTGIGTNGQVLTSNGAGATNWAAAGGGVSIGDAIGSGTAGSVLFVDGSGNLGQNNANLFWSVADTRLGVGTLSPATRLHVATDSATSPRGIISSQHTSDANGARLHLRKSRGTNGSPSTVVTGDTLGQLVGSGYDGTGYLEMGTIDIVATGTIGTNRIPTEMRFFTASNASPSVLTQRMSIDNGGTLTIAGNMTMSGKVITLSADYSTYTTDIRFRRSVTAPAGDWHFGVAKDSSTTANPGSLLITRTALYGPMGSGEIMVFDPNTYVGIIDTTPDAQLDVATSTVGTVGLIVQAGQAGQTADLLQINDNTPTTMMNVTKDGNLTAKRLATTPTAATITSVTTMVCNSNVMTLTGTATETLTTITGGVSGQLLTLIFVDGNITVTDTDAHTANTIDLAGTATNLTSADDLVLMLVFDGTSFYEVSRSAN